MNNKPLYTIFNKSYNLRIGYFVIALTFFMNKKKSSLNKFLQCCSHFVNQAKHGIIVKVFILLISGQKWAVKFKEQGLNPWYERNLEDIMMNMQNMMKQAQKLQKQMEKSQAELAATTFTGKSAQDLVVAELTGDKKVVNITFADAVVDPDDVETLQDMTVQALNNALEQIDEATKKSMGAFAGKLPF